MKALFSTHFFLLILSLVSCSVFADAVVDPLTEPAMNTSSYELSNSDLSGGNVKGYRSWFENGAWQGDIIEYTVSDTGIATTSIDFSVDPPANILATNWSARLQFDAAEATDNNYWINRNIITSTTNINQVNFLWGSLTNQQKAALDNTAFAAADNSSIILNYIRGERVNEDGQNPVPATPLRRRYNLLGDIIHANPVYVGAPAGPFSIDDYASFRSNNVNRAGRVYAAANDGMLHAFDAVTGDEVYAYVPSMVIPNLSQLTAKPYNHRYFVDGQLNSGDAYISNTSTWHSYLTAGLGSGGKGLFILDITSPDFNVGQKIAFELTENHPIAGDSIGYIHGKAQIALFPDGNWYAVSGNGYLSTDDNAQLVMVNLSDNSVTTLATNDALTGNGLSTPALVDVDGDFIIDYAYAGDLLGNVWKFSFKYGASPTVSKLFTASDLANSTVQPITSAPDIARHPYGGYMVYFGTGSLLSAPDTINSDISNTDIQAFYGIWDKGSTVTNNNTNILPQPLTEIAYSASIITRISSNTVINWAIHNGWRVDLPDQGERLVGDPQLRAGRLQFTTNNPLDGGRTWLMEIDYLNGGVDTKILFDLDEDGARDTADLVNLTIDANGYPVGDIPIGINYGSTGIFSQPTIGRINNNSDTLLINGLLMPNPPACIGFCSSGFVGGHIDVDTDSPIGGTVTIGDHTRYGPRAGIGGGTDAHIHEYDKSHGVVFVDLLRKDPASAIVIRGLEPRRETFKLKLDSGYDSYGNLGNGDTIVNAIEETCDPLDQAAAGCRNNTPKAKLFDANQKFIVVLSNADINPGATITIAGKTWNVKEYQDMITNTLLALSGTQTAASSANFKDNDGDSLVFTLNSLNNSLQVNYDNYAISDGDVLSTIYSCVWGTTSPYAMSRSRWSYPLLNTDDAHITRAQEQGISGYRWRNGSLTVQLINADQFTLQSAGIPRDGSNKPIGGSHALYYDTVAGNIEMNANRLVRHDVNTVDINGDPVQFHSGLLYEVAIFNHYGFLYELIRTGGPVRAPCYGSPNWSAAVGIERRGLTLGEYRNLTDPFKNNQALQDDFAAALAAFENAANEAAKLIAYNNLKAIIDSNGLRDYFKYRSYIGKLIPPNKLLEHDKQFANKTVEQAPNISQDASDDGGQGGQNFRTGRRTWIDM